MNDLDVDVMASLDGVNWMHVAPCVCDQLAGESCEWCGSLTDEEET